MSRFVPQLIAVLSLSAIGWSPSQLDACPFCSAASQTLSEELLAADAVVLAKAIGPPDGETGKAMFRVTEVIKGKERLKGATEIEVTFFGKGKPETIYLVTGIGQPSMDFTTPLPLGTAAVGYVRTLFTLPKQGPDRLFFFQGYLQNDDPMLAQDAYDEFARAPYQDLIGMKDRIDHDQLVRWVEDPDVPPSRRRLYLTMLGVCRDPKDLPMLEKMIRSKDRRVKLGLDAMIASYLRIKGPAGLALIEELYLKNHDAAYQDTYAAVTALRFHGQEKESMIPRERILESMRYLLDHPDLADQIIPDLARWQDWSVLDRMAELFKKSDEQSRWVRIPIVNYLRVASKVEGEVGTRATASLAELAKIDPESIQRANSFFAFGALSGAASRGTVAKTKPAEQPVKEEPAKEGSETEASEKEKSEKEKPVADPPVAKPSVEAPVPPEPSPAATPSPTPIANEGAKSDQPVETVTAEQAVPVDGAPEEEVAPSEATTSAVTATAAAITSDAGPPSRFRIVGIAVVLGALLLATLWWILHRPEGRTV
ncbi:MAG: hypothetical protein ACC645_02555 [Pirellulales bacterium]